MENSKRKRNHRNDEEMYEDQKNRKKKATHVVPPPPNIPQKHEEDEEDKIEDTSDHFVHDFMNNINDSMDGTEQGVNFLSANLDTEGSSTSSNQDNSRSNGQPNTVIRSLPSTESTHSRRSRKNVTEEHSFQPTSPSNIIKIDEKSLKAIHKRLLELTQDVEMLLHSNSKISPQSLQLSFKAFELIPYESKNATMYDDQSEEDIKTEERDEDSNENYLQTQEDDEYNRISDEEISKNFIIKDRIFLAATEIFRLFDYKNQKTFIALCRRKNICFYEACDKNWKRLKNRLNISYRSYSMKYYLIDDLMKLAEMQNMRPALTKFKQMENSMRNSMRQRSVYVRTTSMSANEEENDHKANTAISSADEGKLIIMQSVARTNENIPHIHKPSSSRRNVPTQLPEPPATHHHARHGS
eukprot:CAMPEP_0117420950 /NCGR_PEP_ID=MMETSP0758-20121206/2173_1 /TAXON_ID=63605 /ORGANISM="Percolomonas cosmopolitus, Strain AE-1 (ATCC 50343)" /LENGTH=411 /DNA_ID=CAMNT_0005202849 /DNA_START=145 /DNA_END=1377 /DNA_ORIENTATION=-